MLSATFIGEVQQGRLRFGQPLAEFEGKQVLVTLIAPDASLSSGQSGEAVPRLDEEIIEDPGRIQMPPRETAPFQIEVVDRGRLPMRVYSSDQED